MFQRKSFSDALERSYPEAAQLAHVSETIMEALETKGGDTVSLQGLKPLHGFVVSTRAQHERKLRQCTIDDIFTYLEEKKIYMNGSEYVGAWLDGDVVYLDIVEVIPDVTKAIEAAKKANQLAIYHLDTQTTLRLE